MITVTYRPKKRSLTIKGHANAGEKGFDIICASVSTVFYNLCQMMREYDHKAFVKPIEMQDISGSAKLQVTPASGYETWIDHDMLYALTGFKLLAGNFPQYVNLKVMQK